MSESNEEDVLPEVLNNEVKIPVGDQAFYFRVPGISDQIRLGVTARAIRRRYDPNGAGDLYGLDQETSSLAYACACFEVLLVKADSENNWPFAKGEKGQPVTTQDGKPVVDHTKFPADQMDVVIAVGVLLEGALLRFRAKRSADRNAARGQTVASG